MENLLSRTVCKEIRDYSMKEKKRLWDEIFELSSRITIMWILLRVY